MKTLISFLLFFTSFAAVSQTKVEHVDAATFKQLIDANKGVLIDLRTHDELKNKGYIKGARQIDYLDKQAENTIAGLDKSKTYLIYCAGGGRSGECVELMSRQGFTHVVNLEKGFDDWKRKGFATETLK